MSPIACSLLLLPTLVLAAPPTVEFRLWNGDAPLAKGQDPAKDIPTLTPYWPAAGTATGASVIICPGGGYGGLCDYEGRDYAIYLNQHGIAGFVLKYRLGSNGYHHPAEMYDVQRAIRYVRSHCDEWKLDLQRIGVMGSSAGGHLAATAATHFDDGDPTAADPVDRVSCRPDLAILCYPVVTMGAKTHQGSKDNLLGPNPDPATVRDMSCEQMVTDKTSPCFIFHTFEDETVPVENSLDLAMALRAHGVPFDLHIYQKGAHGTALGFDLRGYKPEQEPRVHPWVRDMLVWLGVRGFTTKK